MNNVAFIKDGEEFRYANHHGYSDVNPWEIVRVVSEKCLEIRAMKGERDPDWKPEIIPGGFAGHCTNNHSQKSICETNPEGAVKKIRLRKDGRWYDKYKNRHVLNDHPIYFYDYNF